MANVLTSDGLERKQVRHAVD